MMDVTLHVSAFADLTADKLYDLLALRTAVFVVEQNCVYQDLDGKDRAALHVWAEDERGVAAYARVLPAGMQGETVAIGRVVTRDRGCGLGRLVMQRAIREAEERLGADVIRLEAQCYARGFYERLGFAAISEPFMEDGIPHMLMERRRAVQDMPVS